MSAYRYVYYIEEKVSEYKDGIVDSALIGDASAVSMLLTRLVEEVIRDSRHKAAELATQLHTDLMNLNLDEIR